MHTLCGKRSCTGGMQKSKFESFLLFFFSLLFVSMFSSSNVGGVSKSHLRPQSNHWDDLNPKAVWWVTCETWRKEGYFFFFILFFFSFHNLLHPKRLSFHSSGLYLFFWNIMFLLALSPVVVLFFKKLFLFKFSPINCSGDASEFAVVLKKRNQFVVLEGTLFLPNINITQAYFCMRQSQPYFNSPVLLN